MLFVLTSFEAFDAVAGADDAPDERACAVLMRAARRAAGPAAVTAPISSARARIEPFEAADERPLAVVGWQGGRSGIIGPMPPRAVAADQDALRSLSALPAAVTRRPHLAGPAHRPGAAVVQRRPARRQSGTHRSDGPRAQAPLLGRPAARRLQGDRGRLPVGLAARLRLHPPADRRRPDPGRRDDPGADAVPPRADRAHVRVACAARRARSSTSTTRPPSCSAASSSARAGQASSRSPPTPRAGVASWSATCRAPTCATSTRPRASPAPSPTSRSRSAKRSWTRSSRPSTRKLILNLPATVEMYTPNVYGDVIEWFHRHVKDRDDDRAQPAPAQRPRLRGGRGRVRGDGRRRPHRGHAVRQRRADRQRGRRSRWR